MSQPHPLRAYVPLSLDEWDIVRDAILDAAGSATEKADMWAGRKREAKYRDEAASLDRLRDRITALLEGIANVSLSDTLTAWHRETCDKRWPHMVMAPRPGWPADSTPVWRPRLEGDPPNICTCGLDLALSRSEQDEEKKNLTRVDAMGASTDSPTASSNERDSRLPELDPVEDGHWLRLAYIEAFSHPPTDDCPDMECMLCGMRDCPDHEPLHYHHDGCPCCSQSPAVGRESVAGEQVTIPAPENKERTEPCMDGECSPERSRTAASHEDYGDR